MFLFSLCNIADGHIAVTTAVSSRDRRPIRFSLHDKQYLLPLSLLEATHR